MAEPPQTTGMTNPFMAAAAVAAVEPAAAVADAPPDIHGGDIHGLAPLVQSPVAIGTPTRSESTGPLPPSVVASTRPGLSPEADVQNASTTQPPSSPRPDLSVHIPTSTPPAAVTRAQEDQFIDPQVATLQAMFPDIEVSILQLVLEESGGDTDKAIEALLAMSDPTYQPPVQAQQHQVSIVPCDAQFTRPPQPDASCFLT